MPIFFTPNEVSHLNKNATLQIWFDKGGWRNAKKKRKKTRYKMLIANYEIYQ